MNTGQRMKYRRKELDLPVEEIARVLGVSVATVYRYENGDIEKVPGTVLEPLAKILRTTPAYLMGWEEQAPAEPTAETQSIAPVCLREQKLLQKYRSLSPEGQAKTEAYLEDLLQVAQYRVSAKEEFAAPIAPPLDTDWEQAIDEAEQLIAQTNYARIAAYKGKNFLQQEHDEKKSK